MRNPGIWGAVLLLAGLAACTGDGSGVRPGQLTSARILTQPAALMVVEPSPATLRVVAGGSEPLTYQWQKSGTDIPGATQASLIFGSTHPSDSGLYAVVVDNAAHQPVTSNPAQLTVSPAPTGPPRILQQPMDLTVTAPAPAVFQVGATGSLPLSYSWKKNNVLILGANLATLTLSPTSISDAGTYTVTVSNGQPPDAMSQPAVLRVIAPIQGIFVPTAGALATPRTLHTATLLPDGRVLIVGGTSYTGPVSLAEMYDPATNRFTTLAATLQVGRFDHTATLLSDGKVLLAGGTGTFGPLTSAEVFEPTSGTFTRTNGDLQVGRAQHTATLLGNGKVLLTGGRGGIGPLSGAELYDPATGRFTAPSGSLALARTLHTATLLSDGRVALIGGLGINGALTNAERFDPATGGFTAYGSLSVGRSAHTAVRLGDGRVLVAGGAGISGPLASAELANNGAYVSSANSMHDPRSQATAALLADGRVLVSGGFTGTDSTSSADLFNPATNQFTPTGSMGTPRVQATATALKDGRVLVVGGMAFGGFLASAERFQ